MYIQVYSTLSMISRGAQVDIVQVLFCHINYLEDGNLYHRETLFVNRNSELLQSIVRLCIVQGIVYRYIQVNFVLSC